MSIRFNGQVFESYLDFFNPTKNLAWQTADSSGQLTVTRYKEYLIEFYSRDNVQENFFAYTPNFCDSLDPYETHLDVLNQVLSLPDDLLWCLHFMNIVSLNEVRIAQYPYRRIRDSFYPESWSRRTVLSHDDFLLCAQEISRSVTAIIDQEPSRLLDVDYVYQGTSSFTARAFLFLFNYYYAMSQEEGSNQRPSDIAQSPNVVVNFHNGRTEQEVRKGRRFDLIFHIPVTPGNRTHLYRCLNYRAAPTDYISWPIVEKYEKSPVLYGIELECSTNLEVRKIIDAQAIPFFICKQDASISGTKSHSYEMVTVPMSFKAHKKHWAHWFSKIDYNDFDCTTRTSNGMHIHIDRKAFENDKHIRNMTWFYLNPVNQAFIIAVSERGSLQAMEAYTPIASFNDHVSRVNAFKTCVSAASQLRGIVNFGKSATIEIRMFRGIVSFAELMKNLEFVDAVREFSAGERTVNNLGVKDFITWLNSQPKNKYIAIRKFIDQLKNIDDILLESEIRNVIFNLKDPEKIAERLNKSSFAVTNHHISILNRGQKRTYILNKDGLVEISKHNRSKLVDFDRTFEQRYTKFTSISA